MARGYVTILGDIPKAFFLKGLSFKTCESGSRLYLHYAKTQNYGKNQSSF